MDGASRLLSEAPRSDLPRADELMTRSSGAPASCAMLRSALDERSVFLWIGDENPQPELRSVSVVGANYGLAHRNLGSVGVVGPAANGLRDRDRIRARRRPRALPLLRVGLRQLMADTARKRTAR
jgi:hypothetical protein